MHSTFDFRSGTLRRRTLAATCIGAALLVLAGITPALADTRLLQVDVVDRDSGDTLHVYRAHGRPVIAGRPGTRYCVRLVNTSGERVLAVLAIDGVNVVSGETAGVAQRGYVLEPWQRTEIIGWRKSDDEVATFEFTALSASYAARTGRPLDVGVIGVAVFREASGLAKQTNVPLSIRMDAPAPAMPAPSPAARQAPALAAAAAPESTRTGDAEARQTLADTARSRPRVGPQRLGTGHGARETSVVGITTFERASAEPDQRVEIRYDSLDNLVAAGVVPPPRLASTSPHSFPADPPLGYVPDPPLR